jgi:hypothetical protein
MYAVDCRLSWLNWNDETVMMIGSDFRIKFYLVPRIFEVPGQGYEKFIGKDWKSFYIGLRVTRWTVNYTLIDDKKYSNQKCPF